MTLECLILHWCVEGFCFLPCFTSNQREVRGLDRIPHSWFDWLSDSTCKPSGRCMYCYYSSLRAPKHPGPVISNLVAPLHVSFCRYMWAQMILFSQLNFLFFTQLHRWWIWVVLTDVFLCYKQYVGSLLCSSALDSYVLGCLLITLKPYLVG